MRVKFVRRRYYNTRFRDPGEVVEVAERFARAFLRVGAVVPAPNQSETTAVVKPVEKPVEKPKAKFTRRNKAKPATAPEPAKIVEEEPPSTQPELLSEVDEELPEDLPEEEDE